MTFRSVPPPYTTDFTIVLDPLERVDNIALLHTDKLEVFRLELIFPFGTLHAPNVQTAHFFTRLLTSGTQKYSAQQFTEALESMGGFLDISSTYFRTTVTLHGLSQYFSAYFSLLEEVLMNATFPDAELEIHRAHALQGHLIEDQKTSFHANRMFRETIYGTESLAGQTLDAEATKQLTRTDLVAFKSNILNATGCDIFLCGNFSQKHLQDLRGFTQKFTTLRPLDAPPFPSIMPGKVVHIGMEEAMQTSLIMGKRLFNRAHPDFIPFLVTNTLLGGYFGSRLMKTIREEKGLTYGISSSLASNGPDGVFSIRAELNKIKLTEALEAIAIEIGKLSSVPPGEDELSTVKNYIKGSILSNTNTIFDIMDKHKAIHYEHLPADFYERMSHKIEVVNPAKVQEMANAYFQNLSTITAG